MNKFNCDICFKSFNGEIPLGDHLISKKHIKKVQDFESSKNPSERDRDPFIMYTGLCTLCRMELSGRDQIKSHIHGGTHNKARSTVRTPNTSPNIVPQSLNEFEHTFPSTSSIPDPRNEINEYLNEVEKLVENIKVLISKL